MEAEDSSDDAGNPLLSTRGSIEQTVEHYKKCLDADRESLALGDKPEVEGDDTRLGRV